MKQFNHLNLQNWFLQIIDSSNGKMLDEKGPFREPEAYRVERGLQVELKEGTYTNVLQKFRDGQPVYTLDSARIKKHPEEFIE